MSFPVHPASTPLDSSRCKILESRHQYRACHIHVPDAEERLAAIVFNDRYYSFFRLVKEAEKTLQLAAKLVYRGDEVVITRTAKGDAVWIYEAAAWENKPIKPERSPISDSGLWKLLDSERDYQPCQIRVPDVAKPMMAICADRQYFSFLRSVNDLVQAIELAERLAKKGHAARITKNRAWAVWVLETEAAIQS